MWSSLSSYLYNDDGKHVAAAAAASPPSGTAAPRRANNTPAHSSRRTPSPRSSPLTTIMHSGGGSKKLKDDSYSKSDNVAILRGVIVGLKDTGKTSLIRRLRGEDPFVTKSSSSSSSKSMEKRKLMALVPWNVPRNDNNKTDNYLTTIEQEERVQLYVSESAAFLKSHDEKKLFQKEWSVALQSQRGKEWNFVVWMVDPNMKDVLQYLQSGLDILFPRASDDDDDASEKSKETSSSSKLLVQHLCILFNFRDLQREDVKSSIISQAKEIVDKVCTRVKKDQAANNEDKNTTGKRMKAPVVVLYQSSMLNCYGLQQLHSFITLPYLAQKEEQFLRRAKLAEKQHLQLTKTLIKSEVVEYSEFVATNVDPEVIEEKPDKQTIERRRLQDEKEKLKKQLQQQKEVLDTRMHRRKSPVILGNQIDSNDQPEEGSSRHARKLFPSPNKPLPPSKDVLPMKVDGEASLESFFAEDDDDDEVHVPQRVEKRNNSDTSKSKVTSRHVQVLNSDDSSSDSEDSDDDFYIDISGTRSSPHLPKKASAIKMEPVVADDTSVADDERKDTSSGKKDDVDKSESSAGSVHNDSVTGMKEEEQENTKVTSEPINNLATKSADDNPNEKNEENHDEASSLEENDELKKVTTPTESITSDSKTDCGDSSAEDETNEEDADVIADIDNNGEKANGDSSDVESELPVKEVIHEDKLATTTTGTDDTDTDEIDDSDDTQSKDAPDGEVEVENLQPELIEEDKAQNPDEEEMSEDEFIVPASNDEQMLGSDEESSKVGENAGERESESDNVEVESNGAVHKKAVPTQSTKSSNKHESMANGTAVSSNYGMAVSNAALAAIEQAKLEAEAMMAQSQPTKPKKSKKKEKAEKKTKKSKKSKKKAMEAAL